MSLNLVYDWGPDVNLASATGSQILGGSLCMRADGKVLGVFHDGLTAYYGVATLEDLELTANALWNSKVALYTHISTAGTYGEMLYRLPDGTILLFLLNSGVIGASGSPYEILMYTSVNGLGTDFVYTTTVDSVDLTTKTNDLQNTSTLGFPIMTPSGRIILPYCGIGDYRGYVTYRGTDPYVAYSDNLGATWTVVKIVALGNSDVIYGVGLFNTRLAVFVNSCVYYSDNWGETWIKGIPATSDCRYSHFIYTLGGWNYYLKATASNTAVWLYRKDCTTELSVVLQDPYQLGSVGSGATWEGPINPTLFGSLNRSSVQSLLAEGKLYFISAWGGAYHYITIRTADISLYPGNICKWRAGTSFPQVTLIKYFEGSSGMWRQTILMAGRCYRQDKTKWL